MATVDDLTAKVRSLLDDDYSSSARYDLDKDILPAMNSAIDYLVAVFSAGFESKQIKPEILGNMIISKAFDAVQATTGGTVAKIDITDLNYNTEVWKLLGVAPNPTITGSKIDSSETKTAQRMTLEQWNHSQENPFMRGYTGSIPSDFEEASYTGPGGFYGKVDSGEITMNVEAGVKSFTRSSGSFIDDGFEAGKVITFSGFSNAGNNITREPVIVTDAAITFTDGTGLVNENGDGDERAISDTLYLLLRPFSILDANLKVLIYYLRVPTALTLTTSTIDFPVSLHNLIVQKTVNLIAFQHSKDSKYYQVTDKEVKELIALMHA